MQASTRQGSTASASYLFAADDAAARRSDRGGRAVLGAGRRTRGGRDRAPRAARGAARRAVRPHGDRAARAAALCRAARARARTRGRPGVLRARHAAAASGRPRVSGARSPARWTICPRAASRSTCRSVRCRTGRRRRRSTDAFPTSTDEVFGPLGDRAEARRARRSAHRTRRTRLAGAARLPRAVEVGAPARRVARRRQRRAVDAPPERARFTSASCSGASWHAPNRARRASISSRARSTMSRQLAAFALPIMRLTGGVAGAGDVGGVARSVRRARAPRAAAPRSRAARPRRPAADGRDRTGDARRSGARAGRSAGQHRDRPARRGATGASSSPAPRSCAAARSTSCSSRRWPSGCFRRSRARIRCCSTRRASGSTRAWLPRPSGPSSRSCSCGWPSAPPSRGCTSRFRRSRSAKAARACRRCTRSRSGAP